LTISSLVANALGSACGNGKSGNRIDQLGNWNRRPSHRSVRQRSAIRCLSTTIFGQPLWLSIWLIASPAWPPPIIKVSINSVRMEASNALSHHHAAIEQPRRDIGGQRFPALGSFISERERDADSVVASVFVICRLAPKCCRCQLLAALLRR